MTLKNNVNFDQLTEKVKKNISELDWEYQITQDRYIKLLKLLKIQYKHALDKVQYKMNRIK